MQLFLFRNIFNKGVTYKMKKSELKSIIREMIQEELSKMNEAAALQESAEVVTEDVETITEEVITEEMPAAEATKEEPAEEPVAEEPAETEAPVEESVEQPAEEVAEEEVVEEAIDGPDTRTSVGVVRNKSLMDVASDVYNSDEFHGAFAIDGTVYGDEVNAVVEDAIISAYPAMEDDKFAAAVTEVTKHLSEFVAGEDEVADADFYSDDAFADLDRIYKDHFDLEGNAY